MSKKTTTNHKQTSGRELTNVDLIVYSLAELGGAGKLVDVEDIFLRAFEHAPRRLSWRTKPSLPDYKKCSKALRDAEARRPKLLLKGATSYTRQLTAEGQKWVEEHRQAICQILGGEHVPEPVARPNRRLLTRIERSNVYQLWMNEPEAGLEKWAVAELFRCSADSAQAIWRRRLESAKSAAHLDKRELIENFLNELETTHSEWFGGPTK